MHSFSHAHCLAAGGGRRSCLALYGSASGSGLRSPYASSPTHQAVSCSTLLYLWTGSSSPVASHPAFRRRSFLRLRTASVLSDGDFHPTVGAHSQAPVGTRSRAIRPCASGVACLDAPFNVSAARAREYRLYSVLSILAPPVNVLRRTRRKPSTIRRGAPDVVIGQSAADRRGARPYHFTCDARSRRSASRSRATPNRAATPFQLTDFTRTFSPNILFQP